MRSDLKTNALIYNPKLATTNPPGLKRFQKYTSGNPISTLKPQIKSPVNFPLQDNIKKNINALKDYETQTIKDYISGLDLLDRQTKLDSFTRLDYGLVKNHIILKTLDQLSKIPDNKNSFTFEQLNNAYQESINILQEKFPGVQAELDSMKQDQVDPENLKPLMHYLGQAHDKLSAKEIMTDKNINLLMLFGDNLIKTPEEIKSSLENNIFKLNPSFINAINIYKAQNKNKNLVDDLLSKTNDSFRNQNNQTNLKIPTKIDQSIKMAEATYQNRLYNKLTPKTQEIYQAILKKMEESLQDPNLPDYFFEIKDEFKRNMMEDPRYSFKPKEFENAFKELTDYGKSDYRSHLGLLGYVEIDGDLEEEASITLPENLEIIKEIIAINKNI
ncbi:MAG: hypothetical protein HRT47_11030 [Candidatus Caenarcaniphilales bacterium]|nr:hypothetical protein [Candidatus Caenarcaniphilales bacterium]